MKMDFLRVAGLIFLGGWVSAAELLSDPWFVETAAKAGVTHRHHKRKFSNPYAHIMQGYTALGAAVAVADFDGDGWDDFYLTDSGEDGRNALYRNNGDFTFTDVANRAGVAQGNDAGNASSDALWFDYDNDARPDLFVVRFGSSLLYRNLGEGRFKEVSKEAGLDRYANAMTAIAFDYDNDADLDLFVGAYFQPVNIFKPDTPRFFPENFETANNGGGVAVFRNNGDGTFADVTRAAGFNLSGWTLDLGHADYDNDGDQDLYVAADFGTDRLFRNEGDGTFRDVTEKATGIDTKKGMNVDWADYDNDGLQDLYVVNGWVSAGEENYVLDIFEMILKPDVDMADARSWPPMGEKSLSGYQNNRLFHNDGVGFKDVAKQHGLDSTKDGRGVGVADFDNDGRLDVIVANAGETPLLYRNQAPKVHHWVQFRLQGTRSAKSAVGARVTVGAGDETQIRFVDGGNSFAGQSSARLHFGLGSAKRLDRVEVRWPGGPAEIFPVTQVDRMHTLVEGEGKR